MNNLDTDTWVNLCLNEAKSQSLVLHYVHWIIIVEDH